MMNLSFVIPTAIIQNRNWLKLFLTIELFGGLVSEKECNARCEQGGSGITEKRPGHYVHIMLLISQLPYSFENQYDDWFLLNASRSSFFQNRSLRRITNFNIKLKPSVWQNTSNKK
jgi:hypothetical protein